MSLNFLRVLEEGNILLGITSNTACFLVNGKSSFMEKQVNNPSVEKVVSEMGKRIKVAIEQDFCDVIIWWPVQYIMKTVKNERKIIERRPLPLMPIAELCGKFNIFFSLIYCEGHIELNEKEIRGLQVKSNNHFLGECLGEVGGRTWYNAERAKKTEQWGEQGNPNIESEKYEWYAENMLEAKNNYVDYIKRRVEKYKKMGCPISITVDSTALQKYNLKGEVDIAGIEILYETGRAGALARGATKSVRRKFWCSYLPLGYYWGWPHTDSAKLKRWKVALELSFMMGASIIINENGLFSTPINIDSGMTAKEKSLPTSEEKGVLNSDSKFCKSSRKIFAEFARFKNLHKRPQGQPEANIGIIHGNLDGWNNHKCPDQKIWGQHKGEHWKLGLAEENWKYLDVFFPGGYWLSGTPFGQVDIISSDCQISIMRQYQLLVFLGWHSMTETFLSRLKEYVIAGGNVFLSLPHLDTRIDRGENVNLISEKLQKEIFGIKVKEKAGIIQKINRINCEILPGMQKEYKLQDSKALKTEIECFGAQTIAYSGKQPFLIQNKLGKGKIYLLLSWNYSGEKCFEIFIKDLLCSLAKNTLPDCEISVEGSPSLNYAVYLADGKRPKTLYLLEYNPEIDEYPEESLHRKRRLMSLDGNKVKKKCHVKVENSKFELTLTENEMRMVYFLEALVVSPTSKYVFLKSYKHKEDCYELTLTGEGATQIDFFSYKGEITGISGPKGKVVLGNNMVNNCKKFIAELILGKDYKIIVNIDPKSIKKINCLAD